MELVEDDFISEINYQIQPESTTNNTYIIEGMYYWKNLIVKSIEELKAQ